MVEPYPDRLPQLASGAPFVTDGGLETTLIYHEGFELPCFAAFDLLKDDRGVEILRAYFESYLEIARAHAVGFVLDTATWRASADWGARLGYSPEALDEVNRRAVALSHAIRAMNEEDTTPIVVNGVIGPRGDGYAPDTTMLAGEAERYHARQVATLGRAGADM